MNIPEKKDKIPPNVLSLGFSPCPNDTFIFDAMVNGKIDTQGLSFKYFMDDVENLNKKALEGIADITKISYFAYSKVNAEYQFLNSGSALGFGCGPLLISKPGTKISDLSKCVIGIPGNNTTANFLFSIAFPEIHNKKEMLFSEIENAIINGNIDAGLIIHESRFTFEKKGLVKLIDFGDYWDKLTGLPIPLGGIVIKRSIDDNIKKKVDTIIEKSIQYALNNTDYIDVFIKYNAKEMDEEVIKKHIGLYVNQFSLNLGEIGRKAVNTLYEQAYEKKIINYKPIDIFVK